MALESDGYAFDFYSSVVSWIHEWKLFHELTPFLAEFSQAEVSSFNRRRAVIRNFRKIALESDGYAFDFYFIDFPS